MHEEREIPDQFLPADLIGQDQSCTVLTFREYTALPGHVLPVAQYRVNASDLDACLGKGILLRIPIGFDEIAVIRPNLPIEGHPDCLVQILNKGDARPEDDILGEQAPAEIGQLQVVPDHPGLVEIRVDVTFRRRNLLSGRGRGDSPSDSDLDRQAKHPAANVNRLATGVGLSTLVIDGQGYLIGSGLCVRVAGIEGVKDCAVTEIP